MCDSCADRGGVAGFNDRLGQEGMLVRASVRSVRSVRSVSSVF
jgi:hypothetical protein